MAIPDMQRKVVREGDSIVTYERHYLTSQPVDPFDPHTLYIQVAGWSEWRKVSSVPASSQPGSPGNASVKAGPSWIMPASIVALVLIGLGFIKK